MGLGPFWSSLTPHVLCAEAKDYHQQYLHKVPNGYCPSHSTGVSCPIGLGISTGTGVKAE
jgi:peptide-methionine (S)-S-oxide reductase